MLLASQILENENTSIIIFDTEQSKWHAQQAAKRVHRLMEWDENVNNDRFKYFYLSELSTEEREEAVFQSIENHKPNFVFVDGIRDLLYNFNDIAESCKLLDKLKQCSSSNDIHICCVLHENKGDGNARGHLGSELQNKVETLLQVEKENNVTKVKGAFCKNIQFDDFYFRINSDGLPEFCDAELMPKSAGKLKIFDEILLPTYYLSYKDLIDKVISKTNKASRTASRYIDEAVTSGVIIKNATGMYFSAANNKRNNEDEIPF